MSEKVTYWVEMSDYDLDTVEACWLRDVICMSVSCVVVETKA